MPISFGQGISRAALPAIMGFRDETVNRDPSELGTK
jgi:hypothetical protein